MKFCLTVVTMAVAFAASAGSLIVSRNIGDPELNTWKPGDWVTVGGKVVALDERPDCLLNAKGKTLRLEVNYPANTFGGWNCELKPNTLPGKPVKLTGWARLGNDKSWGMSFECVDANTNKFELPMRAPGAGEKDKFKLSTEWQEFVMEFPKEVNGKDKDGKRVKMPIRYPVKLEPLGTNNWGDKNNPKAVDRMFDLFDLRLWTDMGDIPESERGYDFDITFPVIGNTFYYGEDKPEVRVSGGSWIGKELDISFDAKIIDAYGKETKLDIPPMKMLDGVSSTFDLPCTEPGGYTVEAKVSGLPKPLTVKTRYVVVLKPQPLTDEQKEASPYGINVHGGGYVGYEKFARLGFTWVRDYAFTWGWMLRARGDGKYAGWPWYPKICKFAEDVGMKTLPCLMGAVNFNTPVPEGQEGKQKPDKEWIRQMALATATFDNLSAFELDNECDGKIWGDLDAYGNYCQAFGDIVKACRPDAKSVSPGLAGIYVGFTKQLVDKGYFRNIDVVNGHRYCGKDAPEYSKGNANTGMSEAKKEYLRDCFRNWKRAACGDGKFRELWVTEWGWDTLAGQPVSEMEQAAYLQRKWLIGMGNGVEKMFWYWYYDDDTDKPTYFFAGCGIFDRRRNPKPSAAAFSALAHFVPYLEEYIGTANLDENHMAQIVKANGKIVALAYKIKKDGPDLTIKDENCEQVYDMFGKKLEKGRRQLEIGGTWYVGLDPNSDWLKQAKMDIESDFYVRNVGGEPIKLKLTGNDKFDYSVQPPKGWTAEKTAEGFDVTGPAGLGRDTLRFTVTGNNGGVKKVMPVDVDIVPQAYTLTKAADFAGNFKIDIVNQSSVDQDFLIKGAFPEGWAVEPAETHTGMMKPEERKTLSFKLTKSAPVASTEKSAIPRFDVVNAKGMKVDTAPIIPRKWAMRKMTGKIKFDGDLSDWGDKYLVNPFMIGPNGDKDPTKFYFAWSEEGLYMALDVDDSKCFTADPGSFWRAADCFEIMLTTPSGVAFKENQPWSVNDHQLWFCPIIEKNHVFCGYWPNCDEQSKYQKRINERVKGKSAGNGEWTGSADDADMPDCKSYLVKTPRGYRSEMFIPAERLIGWDKVKEDADIGFGFYLTVMDLRDSEHLLYWPNPKADNLMKKPWMWARVKLVK